MNANSVILENLASVQEKIRAAELAADRKSGSVQLVAVSKTHPVAAIESAIEAGQRVFGENRVQEALQKWPGIKDHRKDVQLHLIGALQTNKAREAIQLFDVIETLDRPKLARTLARLMDETGRRPQCLIQVNTGEEPQKAGILPAEADAFILSCRQEYDLPIVGLMCIPPAEEEPSLHFSFLHGIAERNGLATLSMGMSADYETAIQFGATHVRVGTGVFGPRQSLQTGSDVES